MFNDQKIFDCDTHIHPSVESLEPYFDPDFRRRLPELERYKVPARADQNTTPREDPSRHHFALGLTGYRRPLGRADETKESGPQRLHWGQYGGRKLTGVGVIDDAVDLRIADMDEEGTDVHMMVPDVSIGLSLLGDPSIEMSLIRAYHRFVNDLCGRYPGRLMALLVATGTAVEESVAEIETWGEKPWCAGIWPYPGLDRGLDHPDLEPFWKAAVEKDLPILHHSTTWVPPYFPGYRDVDNNRFLARLCSHPWGAMKAMASFIGAGIMDRYPEIRFGILESEIGWLPFWLKRMDSQQAYVGYTADLKHWMSEYVTGSRFFAGIDPTEDEETIKYVMDRLGDGVVMYASDYPHAECKFPDSPAVVLGWASIPAAAKKKLMWENAAKFYRYSG